MKPPAVAGAEIEISLRRLAYERFKDALFAERIRPGEFLSQRELSETLDVPLGPIREALKSLEAERIVTLLPKRGIRVVSVDEAMLAEAYDARSVIEGYAIHLFAETAKQSEIQKLIKETKSFIRRFKSGQRNSAALLRERSDIDYLLHDTIVKKANNPFLEDAYLRSTEFVRLFRLNIGKKYGFFDTPGLDEHLVILDALLGRDTEGACAALAEHLVNGRDRALGR
ncbi:MAG: GntR family transcriptional regulator [Pseudomonadota bacterium]